MTSMKAENKSIKRITKQSWVYKRLKWQPEKVVVQNGKECENIYRDQVALHYIHLCVSIDISSSAISYQLIVIFLLAFNSVANFYMITLYFM